MPRPIARAAAAAALLGGAGALRHNSHQHHCAGSMAPASPPPPLLTRRLRGGADFLSSASLLAHNPEMAKTLVSSKLVSKTRMYGVAVLALGLVLSTLGFMLFFNRTLIGTGNLLTIGGVVLIVGHQRAYAFLAQRERARGSGIFLFGVFLVLRGSARLGVLVRGILAWARTHSRKHSRCLPGSSDGSGRGSRWSSLGSSTCSAILSPRCLAWSRASRSLGPRSRQCSSPRPRPGPSTSSRSECVPCPCTRTCSQADTRRGCRHAREPSSHTSRAQILGTEQDN